MSRRLLVFVALALAACAHAPSSQVVTTAGSSVPSPAWRAGTRAAQTHLDLTAWYEWAEATDHWNAVVSWQQATRPKTPTPSRPQRAAGPGSGSGCANPVISEATAMRESGCRWDAYNATGCSGRGCVGFYQLDRGHFAAQSPWNPSTHGSCYGLDPSTQEGQTECASRLGPGAWNN